MVEGAPDLARFEEAQAGPGGGHAAALAELAAGAKRGHWIWYVFPQLAGLGQSHMSRRYAIRDLDEAVAYLADPVLAARLVEISAVVAAQLRRGVRLAALMGSDLDAAKLVSSLTLFERAAAPDHALATLATEILDAAEAQGHPRCRFTRERLG
jgi:uncharacterized protein (DUF1810 family)